MPYFRIIFQCNAGEGEYELLKRPLRPMDGETYVLCDGTEAGPSREQKQSSVLVEHSGKSNMNNLTMVFLALQLSYQGILFAQGHPEASRYAIKIHDLWNTAQFDTAISYSVRLIKLEPPRFEHIVHDQLSQGILSEVQHQNSSTFLKLLYRTGDRDINRVIAPIYALNAIMETNNKDSVGSHVESFMSLLSNSSDYSSKAESCSL